MRRMKLITVMTAFTLLLGCASMQKEASLYERLGGRPAIEVVTQNLLDIIAQDERIAFLFKDSDLETLKVTIVDQICMETGGPCEYKGLDMVEAHSGLNIKYAEFDAFVEDLILAMEQAGVPFRLQNEVLALFAPMREDVTHQ